jgi:zinc protease
MCKKLALVWLMAMLSLNLVAEKQSVSKIEDLSQQVLLPHEKYTLDNGLDVILSVDKSMPFVAVNVWYQVGSVSEKPHKTGLAHLFEHLMFEGTRQVPASQHFRLLEKAGAFEVNASTSFDRTNYYQTVPKSQLELALSLESSRMFFLAIDQHKLDEQRAVVRREREQRTETAAYGLATQKLWQSVFAKPHPFFGKVIGSHEDLMAASLDDVQDFYDLHYGPQNASLTLVGDFDEAEAKALINKYFATLPKGEKVPEPILPKFSINKQEIIRVDEKLGKLPLVRIHYLTPALFQPGDAEMDVIAHILTGGEYGRLTKAITRDKQLASAVSAYQQSMDQLSVFTIDAMLNPGVNENLVIEEIDKVIADLLAVPPSQIEIERARNSILKTQLFSLQSIGGHSGRAELLQIYNRFAKNPDYIKQDIMRYQVVDQKALESYAKSYLSKEARKVLIAKPSVPHVAAKGL